MNLVVVEMRRALHRRLVWWMVAFATAWIAVAGVIAFLAPLNPENAENHDHPAVLRWWWDAAAGEGTLLIGTTCLLIGAAICGASVAGAEWRAGTVGTVLTWSPVRWRLHLARTASAAILSFVIGLALLVLFMLAAVPAMVTHGDTSGTDAQWWLDLVAVLLRSAALGSMMAVLALSIASLGRNTGAALVALAAWALFVENLIRGVKPGLARFLIGENAATVVPWRAMEDVPFSRGPVVALGTLAIYLLVVVVGATWSFERRDVAST